MNQCKLQSLVVHGLVEECLVGSMTRQLSEAGILHCPDMEIPQTQDALLELAGVEHWQLLKGCLHGSQYIRCDLPVLKTSSWLPNGHIWFCGLSTAPSKS